jgi:hypothetical protein
VGFKIKGLERVCFGAIDRPLTARTAWKIMPDDLLGTVADMLCAIFNALRPFWFAWGAQPRAFLAVILAMLCRNIVSGTRCGHSPGPKTLSLWSCRTWVVNSVWASNPLSQHPTTNTTV